MGDREVLKYKDVALLDSDLDTLRGPCFLTDQIIAFYFSYLSSSYKTDILLVTPSISFWLANCEDEEAVGKFAESCKLSSKRMALFVVNDCDDFGGGDGGSHWSILVYYRTMNAFLHFDSMEGVNKIPAEKMYDAIKKYMGVGGQVSKPQTSSSLKKARNKTKRAHSISKPLGVPKSADADIAPVGLPVFKEWEKTPQQSNGYDCGVYVLAMAKVICDWFLHEMNNNSDVLSTIAKRVDHSVEVSMRSEVLDIIEDLRKKGLSSS